MIIRYKIALGKTITHGQADDGHLGPSGDQPVSPEVKSAIFDLRERVKKLEESAGRTKRGRTNQRGAAQYLGKSREWLRKLHLRGEGPQQDPDGTYSYDNLDAYSEGRSAK